MTPPIDHAEVRARAAALPKSPPYYALLKADIAALLAENEALRSENAVMRTGRLVDDTMIDDLRAENATLRAALVFYARPENANGGFVARAALGQAESE